MKKLSMLTIMALLVIMSSCRNNESNNSNKETAAAEKKETVQKEEKHEEGGLGKNIEFVSISVDKPKQYNTWKNMVKEKEMTGVQLYAKGDRTFLEAYDVKGIPRFILIDPKGKIVMANAPRPSSGNLKKMLDGLNL